MESDWMFNLPDELQHLQLNKLAIPGSHNSGAYNLSTELAPDCPPFLKTLSRMPGFNRFKHVLRKWCECQRLSFREQLDSGIRYLDLRISSKLDSDHLYLVHALYGPQVREALEEVKEFLVDHPGEVVIVDFNHFYKMNATHHQELISLIKSMFGSKLLSRTNLENLNLKTLRELQKQVICIYQHKDAACHEDMWPKECILSPWPNAKQPDICVRKLTRYMDHASGLSLNIFFVCQGILTPDARYAMSHLRRGGIHSMTQQLRPIFFSWLKKSPTNWPSQPNVVIHDFVDEDNYIQCVLELNKCRLEEKASSP